MCRRDGSDFCAILKFVMSNSNNEILLRQSAQDLHLSPDARPKLDRGSMGRPVLRSIHERLILGGNDGFLRDQHRTLLVSQMQRDLCEHAGV